jgi:hypothetical protein
MEQAKVVPEERRATALHRFCEFIQEYFPGGRLNGRVVNQADQVKNGALGKVGQTWKRHGE